MIPGNKLCIALSPQDKAIMKKILQASPLTIGTADADDLHVTLLYADKPLEGFDSDDSRHVCPISGAYIVYDSALDMRNLILELDAPTLEARREEVLHKYGVRPLKTFSPRITLLYDMPPYNPKIKWYINQLINSFNSEYVGYCMTLQGEYIEDTDNSMRDPSDLTVLHAYKK